MILCVDCRFLGRNFGFGDACVRDSVLATETTKKAIPIISPVDGAKVPPPDPKFDFSTKAFDRRMTGDCGMDAVLFEPKK